MNKNDYLPFRAEVQRWRHAQVPKLSYADIGRKIGYSECTVSQVMNGTYRTDPNPILNAIAKIAGIER